MASFIRPPLTTVALPHYQLGQAAINVLLNEDPDQPHEPENQPSIHRIPMPLRVRASVRPADASADGRSVDPVLASHRNSPTNESSAWSARPASEAAF